MLVAIDLLVHTELWMVLRYRVIRLENDLTALLISGAELSAQTPTYIPTPTAPFIDARIPSRDQAQSIPSRVEAATVNVDEDEDDEDDDNIYGEDMWGPRARSAIQFDGYTQVRKMDTRVVLSLPC